MSWHHLAHFQSIKSHIKKGTKIRRGDVIGEVGNSGTHYAHLHFEVMKQKPERWTQYVYDRTGRPLTEDQVRARYEDPNPWIDKAKKIPARYTSMAGWEYMDVINRSLALHPGVDINDGVGNQDMGNIVKSPCDGTVAYIGKMEGGWGNHIWIEETKEPLHDYDLEFAKAQAGRLFLQVEEHGEAWYVDPKGFRVYIGGTPAEMLSFVQSEAVGITNEDLNKIPERKT